MAKKQIDLGLTGLDELFMDDKERVESQLPKIYEIPLSEIDEFPNHPFHVRLDEDMDQLVESIKERGIITPVTLRQKPDGRYEIVSGHRRTKACELAGLTTVKAEIKELSRDEAIILMVESNLQRTTILPSEKAFSYKMRLEAMNRQNAIGILNAYLAPAHGDGGGRAGGAAGKAGNLHSALDAGNDAVVLIRKAGDIGHTRVVEHIAAGIAIRTFAVKGVGIPQARDDLVNEKLGGDSGGHIGVIGHGCGFDAVIAVPQLLGVQQGQGDACR